jgi:DNA-directed RNA polymerase subunit RPC12/RpoP
MEVCKAKEMFRAGIKTEPIGKPKARILLLDIETAPMKAYVWGRWKQNISLSQTISEWFMLSWSAKWLGEEDVMSAVLTPDEALAENDERIVYRMWQLLNEAHVVVGHNCVRFDMPKIQSRFIVHGFPPCTPYKQIDTLKVAKQQFGFSSNKLDALATYFGVENKINTSFELWQGCLDGDQESLLYMEEYNKMDVLILEKVYLRLRPYIKSHINIGLLEDKAGVCPHCGSEDLNPIDGEFMFNNTTVSELYRCSSCGAVARGAKNKYPKTFRSSLIRSC